MDIRVNERDRKRLSRTWEKSPLNKEVVSLVVDEAVKEPVVIVHTNDGSFKEYIRGFKTVKELMKYGYHRIRRSCPYRHRRCIGEKCALYHVENGTGDCAHIWALFKGR